MTEIDGSAEALARLTKIVGEPHVLTGSDVSARWDGYPPTPTQALCVVRPATTQEVASVLAYCDSMGLKVVTQGGRTGLAGGAITQPGDIALSLERMRRIAPIDKGGATVEVEAGAPLEAVQEAAKSEGFYYPVDFGARGSATIGGTIATNAGGNSVFRYGMTRQQVLGLEAVLADGTILSSMNRLIKNNAGYDLKQLFVGSEGTLGIVTRAVLRLQPEPGAKATAFVGLSSFDSVLTLLSYAMAQSDGTLTSFEVMWPSFIDCVVGNGNHRLPLARPHAFYVLMEIASSRSESLLEHVVSGAWEQDLIEDAVLAQTFAQARAFWAMRDDIDALISASKPAFLYDISLPQRHMAAYVEGLAAELADRWANARLATFGHVADGNLHLCVHTGNIGDHMAVDALVYGPLHELGGSVSAEHGIGLEKLDYLPVSRTPEEIAVMRRLKQVLDPHGTLNPGKIFGPLSLG